MVVLKCITKCQTRIAMSYGPKPLLGLNIDSKNTDNESRNSNLCPKRLNVLIRRLAHTNSGTCSSTSYGPERYKEAQGVGSRVLFLIVY